MSNRYPWFKVWNEMVFDPKLSRIAREVRQSRAFVIGAWITLLAMASESPERGTLYVTRNVRVTDDDIAESWILDLDKTTELLDAFIHLGLLQRLDNQVLMVTNWEKRQAPPDPTAAKRMREKRAKDKAAEVTRNVTPMLRVDERGKRIDLKDDDEGTSRSDLASVSKKYETEIGGLTAAIRPKLIDAIDEFSALWVIDAIDEAVIHNARSWAYVMAVLKNRKTGGIKTRGRKNGSGSPRTVLDQNIENALSALSDIEASRAKKEEAINGNP